MRFFPELVAIEAKVGRVHNMWILQIVNLVSILISSWTVLV